MSYILDALRKSDQQRQRGATPTLQSAQSHTASAKPRSPWAYAVLVIVLAGAAFSVGWLRPWQTEGPVARADTVPVPVAESKPADTPIATRSIVSQAPQIPQTVQPPQSAEPAPPIDPPAMDEPRHKTVTSVPAKRSRATTKLAAAKVSQPAPAEAVKPPPENIIEKTADSHQAAPAKEDKIAMLADLPPSVRQELPAMTITVHSYSRTPKDRLVGVNDKLLHEGDSLAPDLVLETITPKGMIFSYKGTRFQRGVQ